jgi:hypothetical protein
MGGLLIKRAAQELPDLAGLVWNCVARFLQQILKRRG